VNLIASFSTVLSFLIVFLIPVCTASTFYVLKQNINNLESEVFKERFKVLVEGQNTKALIGIFWQPLVNLRWILTNLILVILRDYPEVQLQLLLFTSILI
jgi:Na+/H+ antiporter NhaC